ncbi:ankyrin repeat domain-containing protein [Flavobacterium phycosphaerae]|uniref:ankyrin repeat domain-containing protein n=1 Tax=Flavobacterium phycosphaerae TaxID=2697515 RepID=UPI00293BFCEB|nr:ankyrin repeat domain-containing protein [Flavobacterium phycosphaerae]
MDPNSPLCTAIYKGDLTTVKKFVEYGADVNEESNGMTPLMFAARYNKVDIIKYLLEKGAKKEVKDERGYTALKYAEFSNSQEALAILKQA